MKKCSRSHPFSRRPQWCSLFLFSVLFFSGQWCAAWEDVLNDIDEGPTEQVNPAPASVPATGLSGGLLDRYRDNALAQPAASQSGTVGDSWKEQCTGMVFVPVKGGCFQMGKDPETGELYHHAQPIHEVCVDSFFMARYEVRQNEFVSIVGANPAHFAKGGDYAVENLSWQEIDGFLQALNKCSGKHFRLPTEAEWEYAARSGGKDEKYAGGNDIDQVAWYEANAGNTPHPVGQKAPNGLGLYDMSGNVMELCSDWYGPYQGGRQENPTGPDTGSQRVIRGGSWNGLSTFAQTAKRYWQGPEPAADLGFRLVLSGKEIQ